MEARFETLVVRARLASPRVPRTPVKTASIRLFIALHHLLGRSTESTVVSVKAEWEIVLVESVRDAVLVVVELDDGFLVVPLPGILVLRHKIVLVECYYRVCGIIGILPTLSVEHSAGHHGPCTALGDTALVG